MIATKETCLHLRSVNSFTSQVEGRFDCLLLVTLRRIVFLDKQVNKLFKGLDALRMVKRLKMLLKLLEDILEVSFKEFITFIINVLLLQVEWSRLKRRFNRLLCQLNLWCSWLLNFGSVHKQVVLVMSLYS